MLVRMMRAQGDDAEEGELLEVRARSIHNDHRVEGGLVTQQGRRPPVLVDTARAEWRGWCGMVVVVEAHSMRGAPYVVEEEVEEAVPGQGGV